MKLTILGSGTCIPNTNRGSSGYLLETPISKILFDCGSGTTWKLEEIGINYLEIDHIFFSHLHPDHTGDLVPFLFATKYSHNKEREKPLFLWGGKGFNIFFNALREAYGDWIAPDGLNFYELNESAENFDDFTINAVKTPHTESSLAYKVESEGKSIVYSGDTDYSESLINLTANTDLLIIECALANDSYKMRGHLTPDEVIRTVNKSRPKKVVVTHLYPECDEKKVVETIRKNVSVEVIEAQDLLEVII